jgi:hypothetical protein
MPAMDCYISTRQYRSSSSSHPALVSLVFFDPLKMSMTLAGEEVMTVGSGGLKGIQMESWQVLKTDRIRVSRWNTLYKLLIFVGN